MKQELPGSLGVWRLGCLVVVWAGFWVLQPQALLTATDHRPLPCGSGLELKGQACGCAPDLGPLFCAGPQGTGSTGEWSSEAFRHLLREEKDKGPRQLAWSPTGRSGGL